MLKLFFSNQYERLSERLFEDLSVAPGDPFVPEQIIVPGTALRRRLEMDYADHFGVCAQVQFGYLAQWVWQQIGLVIAVPDASPFDAERLTWRIFRAFGDAELIRPHPRLARYLAKADGVMRYAFAQRLARLMEQYITYRPDWLAAWSEHGSAGPGAEHGEAAPDEAWQAALWRHLAAEMAVGREHPSLRFVRTLESLAAAEAAQTSLLQPASLFCLPTIPPLYLDILVRIAERVDLNLYALSPCREYWHDLIDAKRLARLDAAGLVDYHEVGHRLLAGWGRQAQALLALLQEKSASIAPEQEDYAPSGRGTLLAAIQDGILTLSRPARFCRVEADRSFEVHVCHSLTRELEVLHDQLLDMLSSLERLSPADILVVMPALEEAAPLIHAVFGTVPENRRMPYAITGLPRATANPAAAALLAVLDLLASRFKASEVFALLRRPLIQARFGLGDQDLEHIHQWMREAGICWGLDGKHRAGLGLPSSEHHSLRDGLDRLFLGYAVPDLAEPLDGRLPAGDVEGSEALALGVFDYYVGCLEQARRECLDAATAEGWRLRMNDWIDEFLCVDSASIHDVNDVRGAIAMLCDDLAAGAGEEPLTFDVISAALKDRLQDPARGALPSGAVTFAGMSPLRNLPYRVVCILGLNDGAFPVIEHPDEFDLIAQAPRLGDRQRRSDDRNVFLDLVLAARERLFLSYTGFSIRDNSALTPSIVLAELLDHAVGLLTDAASADAAQAARQALIVQHPLQAFSRRYFSGGPGSDPRLFSYAAEYAQPFGVPPPALAVAVGEAGDDDVSGAIGAPFFTEPLPWPEEQARELTLDDLKRFVRNPCRFLLERRLALSLPEADDPLADDEPFLPNYSERGALAERLLPAIVAGAGAARIAALAEAGTEYPSGVFGDVVRGRELGLITAYGNAIAAWTQAPRLPPVAERLAFAIDGEIWTLSGALNDLRSTGLVRWRYDDTRAVDYLTGWIDHLFLNALRVPEVGRETVWQSRDGSFHLQACAEAHTHLHTLVAYYRHGLAQPLRFFPRSAWAYCGALSEGRTTALAAARRKWRGSEQNSFGECHGTAYRLALRGLEDPLDETFEDTAAAICLPLLEHLDDERLR